MRVLIFKSVAIGLLALLASLALSFTFVPLMGGKVAGAGLIMTIVCPLLIGIPASFLHLHQTERIRRAEMAAFDALARLTKAHEELRVQARLDGLTGALNRSAFREDLEDLARNGTAGVLIFLDLDHFKSINDRYGHSVGDEVLRQTGLVLTGGQGQRGIVGRLGGEEFAIFRAGLKIDDVLAQCEAIRKLIQQMDVRSDSGARVPVSASLGAYHCAAGFNALECLKVADVNLYQAKARGRNRVVATA